MFFIFIFLFFQILFLFFLISICSVKFICQFFSRIYIFFFEYCIVSAALRHSSNLIFFLFFSLTAKTRYQIHVGVIKKTYRDMFKMEDLVIDAIGQNKNYPPKWAIFERIDVKFSFPPNFKKKWRSVFRSNEKKEI